MLCDLFLATGIPRLGRSKLGKFLGSCRYGAEGGSECAAWSVPDRVRVWVRLKKDATQDCRE